MKQKILIPIIISFLMIGIVSAEQCNETLAPCGGGCTSTDLTGMFYAVTNFDATYGDITGWNTSCITNMQSLFYASDFNQDISGWDTSQVTKMESMFQVNHYFNQPIGSWNTSKVTTMRSMFIEAPFNQDIGSWDTGSVTNMYGMFYATPFDQDIGGWDVSQVTTMGMMFGASNLSTTNYDALLNGWAAQTVQNAVPFDGGNSQYSSAALSARNDSLIGVYGWTITDGGMEIPTCSVCNETCSPCGGGCTSTDMNSMFLGVTNFDTTIGDITGWNTSCITSFYNMFQQSDFNQDISGWDTSNVNNMDYMFVETHFNQPIGSWDMSSVTQAYFMFQGDTDFNQDLSLWNTSGFTGNALVYMFAGDTSFDQDISMWDISQVTDMTSMFYTGGLSTTNYDALLNGWASQSVQSNVPFDAGNSQYSSAGLSARNDTLIGSYGWTITDGGLYEAPTCSVCNETCSPCSGGCTATDMSIMFSGVTDFNNTVGDITGWNTSCITNMYAMFYGSDFNQDISGWDTSSVTDMGEMFHDASYFNQPIGSWDTSSVTTFVNMFSNAYDFNQDLSGWNTSQVTDMSSMFLSTAFNQDISIWDTSKVINMGSMFADTPFNQDISGWDVGQVTDMNNMFRANTNFNQNINAWNTSSVTMMWQMFYGATAFNQPIGSWDTSKVIRMDVMFYGSDFNQDISGWDVSNVNTMTAMFGETLFNQPIGSWDTSSLTGSLENMFYGDTAFNQDISGWNISQVTGMVNMFYGATLSTTNYDALLNGWASQIVQYSVPFDAGNSIYSSAGLSARNDTLIGIYSWVITDGGIECVSNWTCDTFASCNTSNILPCTSVADLNFCGESFTGNLTDYDDVCIYVAPAETPNDQNSFTGAVMDTGVRIVGGLGSVAILVGIIIAGILAFAFVKFIIIKP